MQSSCSNQYVTRQGPLLPIVIQCLPHQEHDLDELKSIVKGVRGGGSNFMARNYVSTVIGLIKNMEIWPHIPKFYACVNGADMPKYVCQHWEWVVLQISIDILPTL